MRFRYYTQTDDPGYGIRPGYIEVLIGQHNTIVSCFDIHNVAIDSIVIPTKDLGLFLDLFCGAARRAPFFKS